MTENYKQTKTKEEEDEEEVSPQDMPSNKDLLDSVNKIQLFMDMNGITSQQSFETVVTAVQRHIVSSRRQTSIKDFFQSSSSQQAK